MSELHDKARALLALREKAKRGPYTAWPDAEGRLVQSDVDDGNHRESGLNELAFIDCALADEKMEATAMLLAASWGMVDTIRDLLAENERLAARLRELANAEPVASISQLNLEMLAEGKAAVVYPKILACSDDMPLIHRPEMPS